MIKIKVLNGEHKGKIGIVTGTFWASNVVTVRLEDGNEHFYKLNEVDYLATN